MQKVQNYGNICVVTERIVTSAFQSRISIIKSINIKRGIYISFVILFIAGFNYGWAQAPVNDDCGNATYLVENEKFDYCDGNPNQPTTEDATGDSSNCFGMTENSVWFKVQGNLGGNAEIEVTQIDSTPGLEVQLFKSPACDCDSLISMPGKCGNGNANDSIEITFNAETDTCYYIMIDGWNGNEEDFKIDPINIDDGALVQSLSPRFGDNAPVCVGDSVTFINQTRYGVFPNTRDIAGGDIKYEWAKDISPWRSTNICSDFNPDCPDSDTNMVYQSPGFKTPGIRSEIVGCGHRENSLHSILVRDLVIDIDTLGLKCAGTPTGFVASATILPSGSSPSISQWEWTFYQGCDTNTFVDNDATNPDTFYYAPCSYDSDITVELIAKGATCGPADTIETFSTIDSALKTTTPDTVKICQGGTANFCVNVDSTTGEAPYSFNWNGGPQPPSPDDSVCTSVSGLSVGGPYEYRVTVTDANGCQAFDTVNVLVRKPQASANRITSQSTDCSGGDGYCAGDSVSFEYSVNSGEPPYTISWSPQAGLHDTLQYASGPITDTAYVKSDTSITYTMVVTDSLGCKDTTNLSINIHPPPEVNTTPTCAGDTAAKSEFCVTGSCPGSSYDWTLSAPHDTLLSSTVDSCVIADFSDLPAGDYDFGVEVTDGVTGCIDTTFFTYTLDTPITFNIEARDTQFCEDTCTILSINGDTSGVRYDWFDDGSKIADDTTQIRVCPNDTNTYTAIGSRPNCTGVDSITLNVDSLPQAIAQASQDTVCHCDTVQLNGTGSSTGPPFSYAWTSQAGNTIQSPNNLNTEAYVCQPDTFTLNVTNTNTGCTNDSAVAVHNYITPAPVAEADPDSICYGDTTTVTLDGRGSDTQNIIFSWTANRPVTINNADSIVATSDIDTTTTFTLTVNDTVTGCDSSTSITIYSVAQPVAAAQPLDSACTCDTVPLDGTGSTTGSKYVYDWESAAGNPIADTSALVTSALACTKDTFTLTVRDTNVGCTTDTSITVDTLPVPTALTDVTPDTLCVGEMDTITLDGSSSSTGPAYTYQWTSDPSVTIINADSIVATAYTDQETDFILTVTDTTNDCLAIDTSRVYGYPEPRADVNPDSMCFQGLTNITLDGTDSDSGTNIIYNWSSIPPVPISPTDSIVATATIDSTTTFILTVEDTTAGCLSTDTSQVVVHPLPTVVAAPLDTACQCDSVALDGSGSSTGGNFSYDWESAVGNGIADTSSLITKAEACATDTFTLTVTNTTTGCTDDTAVDVFVAPIPVADARSSPDSFCEQGGTTIKLDGTNSDSAKHFTFNWSASPPVPISNSDSIEATAVIDTTTLFTLTVTDTMTGCDSTDTTLVTVFENPNVAVTPLDTACECEAVSLDGSGSSTGSRFVYSWESDTGNSMADSTELTTTATACNSDTFTLTVTDTVTGCFSDSSTSVRVFPIPGATATATPDTICGGTMDTIRLDTTASQDISGRVIYSWSSSPPVTIINSDSAVAQGVTDTTTVFTLTVTDTVSGCDSSSSVEVFSYPELTATASVTPNAFCEQGSTTVTLDGAGSSSGADIAYQWTSSPAVPINNPDSIVTDATVIDSTEFYLSVSDTIAGCTFYDTTSVIVNPLPDVATTPLDTVCACDTVSLDGTGSSTSGPYAYQWTSDNGNSISNPSSLVTEARACIPDTFTLSVTDTLAGCSNDSSIDVHTRPLPDAEALASPDSLCEGDTAFITLNGMGSDTGSNFTYSWTSSPPVAISDTDSIIASAVVIDSTTTFMLQVTDTLTGCDTVATTTVNVSTAPAIAVKDTGPVCQCQGITLDGAGSSAGNYTYQWTSKNGSQIDNPDSLVTTAYPCVDDSFWLTVTNQVTGCQGDTAIGVQVKPVPLVNSDVYPDTICRGTPTQITLDGRGSQTGPKIIYDWTSDPATAIQNNDSIVASSTISNTTTFTLTVTDTQTECAVDDDKTVLTFAPPQLQADRLNFCEAGISQTTDLYVTDVSADAQYDWSLTPNTSLFTNTPLNDSLEEVSLDGQSQGSYLFAVQVDDSTRRCFVRDSITLNVLPPLNVEAGPDTLIYKGEPVELFAEGGVQYAWSPANSLDKSDISQPTATPQQTTEYAVQIDSVGCRGYDTVLVRVRDSQTCFVPNTFTPNGDGVNDRLKVHCAGIEKLVSFKVFNRWGELVYSANSLHDAMKIGWDGQYKGKKQEMESYAYYLVFENADGEMRQRSGSITLVR